MENITNNYKYAEVALDIVKRILITDNCVYDKKVLEGMKHTLEIAVNMNNNDVLECKEYVSNMVAEAEKIGYRKRNIFESFYSYVMDFEYHRRREMVDKISDKLFETRDCLIDYSVSDDILERILYRKIGDDKIWNINEVCDVLNTTLCFDDNIIYAEMSVPNIFLGKLWNDCKYSLDFIRYIDEREIYPFTPIKEFDAITTELPNE